MVCLQTACCRLVLARQTKPPELLLGFPSYKRFAGWSRRRCPGPTGKRVAGVACSCVPPSSARLRLQPLQPAGRGEGGGKWGDKNKLPAVEPSMRAGSYHKATALMGATGEEPVPLSRAPCPARPAAPLQHRSLAGSSMRPCQLCLRIPTHPRKTRAHGLAALREMPSKPREGEAS